MTANPFSIGVFCGSRAGRRPAYETDAKATGKALAAEGWQLVYGAGDVGLMGAVARAAQEAGGDTFGVIPEHLLSREAGKRDLSRFVVTENMHERKKVMFMNSHAIVVLPGGAGSLDEYFEVVTWKQLGLHDKPIFLLNTEGYWDRLVSLVDHFIDEGFADPSFRAYTEVVDTPAALIAALRDRLSPASAAPE